MREQHWAVWWRLAPHDLGEMFPFPAPACAGVVLVGERKEPGARVLEALAGVETALPVIVESPLPFTEPDPGVKARSAAADAYHRVARAITG